MSRTPEAGSHVEVRLDLSGAVSDARTPDAKKVEGAEMVLRLKPLVADELKFGQELCVTVSTDAGAAE